MQSIPIKKQSRKLSPRVWLVAAFLLVFCLPILAASSSDLSVTDFATPVALLKAPMKTKTDALTLMQSDMFEEQILLIARQLAKQPIPDLGLRQQLALKSLVGHYAETNTLINTSAYPLNFFHYTIYVNAAKRAKENNTELASEILADITAQFNQLNDIELNLAINSLGWSLPMGQDYMLDLFKRYSQLEQLNVEQAVNLAVNYQLYRVYAAVLPHSEQPIKLAYEQRYIIEPNVEITTEPGVTVSAVVVRKRGDKLKRPTAFQFTIYADEFWHIRTAMSAAAHGYIGVIANSRGKRNSSNSISPWEYDGKDATAVIDWISKQPWSDGRVGMYGGSYVGFTQWAAAKYMHPALKTIVPYAAANPLTGLPIENNVFITANYQWAFHVTNNKTTDYTVYNDYEHWSNVFNTLYESGRAFNEIDQIEGTPNPWFQKWLQHPSFDEYYQAMLPYQHDYKKINIPVLSITGYFDGGQISAIDFLTRHYRYNTNADHTLLIGPYTHRTAQGIPGSHVGNYQLDPVAMAKDTEAITFAWFDHVFHGKPKPTLLKGKVNYQLMGSNTWQHNNSYQQMNASAPVFYLNKTSEQNLVLTTEKPKQEKLFKLTVDMADRTEQRNVQPWPFKLDELPKSNGLTFMTEPFATPQAFAGAITGYFSLAINKRDVDIGYNFYELTAEGKVFLLSHYFGRASYAADMGKRQLLTPDKKTQVAIVNGRMTAKLIAKGSCLVMVLDVNKNAAAQVNMGTGKDVSTETAADGKQPLEITWFSDSQIKLPITPWLGDAVVKR